jgi:hypothetical protein
MTAAQPSDVRSSTTQIGASGPSPPPFADTVWPSRNGEELDRAAAGRAHPTENWEAEDAVRARRYSTVAGPFGVKRVVRADGLPLRAPTTPMPVSPAATGNAGPALATFGAATRAAAPRNRKRRPPRGDDSGAGPAPSREQLVRWRREAGLGQRALAARCGLSRSTVAELESGRRAPPGARRRVAAHLGHGDPAEWGDATACGRPGPGARSSRLPASDRRR